MDRLPGPFDSNARGKRVKWRGLSVKCPGQTDQTTGHPKRSPNYLVHKQLGLIIYA
ncbi:hypothetical protein JCM10512_4767 [Bacteroides reticulotermitis JCM 10512]|uniref:Uncharacterized protein n=1 Tax=Bacteroides reticulotermitis JCM 10512 TaxID=1445607 RepID=W4V0C9_9BACE|nr:hypothetical protein JCM10512_4767 [Bacteroides reticulotermitis JCM 10512]